MKAKESYSVQYCQLHYSGLQPRDFFADVSSAAQFLALQLSAMSQASPGVLPALVGQLPQEHQVAMQRYFQQAGVALG